MSYLLWLVIFIWTPLALIWFRYSDLLLKYKKTLSYTVFFALLFGISWDFLAVTNHVWSFPQEGNVGFYVGLVPFEEYLFYSTAALFGASLTIIFKYREQVKG